MFQRPKAIIKDYLLNSSFHGLRFIADDKLHWTERCFWVVCVLLSWYGSSLLILASFDAFQNNAISFVMETTYKDWDTNFPAIAVCETDNVERVYEISDSIWTPQHEVELEEVLKELAYFRGLTFYTLQYCNKKDADPLCPMNNFSFYANLVRSNCRQSIANCKYNDKKFDCCTYFHEIETDVGRCYIINSVQHKAKNAPTYPMINNKNNKLGLLSMEVLIPGTVYTIGEEEVPTLTSLQSDYFPVVENIQYRRHIAIRNIENDPNTRETTPIQRNCRFQDENNLEVYPYYSYSACTVQCRKDHQKKFCNCTDHFMPNTEERDKCGLVGLVCLNQHYAHLSVMRPEWARRSGLICQCPPSCTEIDITVIKDDKKSRNAKSSLVEIEMEYLPTERFKRNVVRSRLDLVVSTGGTTGLFVGASLLSFVELIYYLGFRYYGTVYAEKNRKKLEMNKIENNTNAPTIQHITVDIKRTRSELHSQNEFKH
ncbi:sodium channel protein Nach-like [Arctopsyche grandis]|uniref:sodium channel protein Nach-like n=1 Tax=Arctopsyche grandis TaxID=121162 RepID=UPI00406D87C2